MPPGRPVVASAVYRGVMRRDGEPAGTPDQDEVEQDFTVPDDADLRPVHEDEGDPR